MNTSVNITAPIERTMEESVAELARGVAKPNSRAEAFNALRRIVGMLESDYYDALSPDMQIDMARLWAFFLPKPTPRARSPFDWCAKAIGKNDVRYYLNFVYVTEDEIIGTDGHSLHIAPNTERRESGFYGPEGVRLHGPDYARYPDTKRVQPDPHGPGRQWYDLGMQDLKIDMTPCKDGRIQAHYKLPTAKGQEYAERVHLDARLVKRLFSLDPDETVSVNVGGPADSVLVKLSGKRTAVVMPLRQ